MHIEAIYLKNYRTFSEGYFEFSPHINIIQGPNASGKTNLLEALFFLITGRSFRTIKTQELIKHSAPSFYLEMHFVKHGISQSLKVEFSSKKRSIYHNSTEYDSFVQLLGLLQGVLLTPADSDLVEGTPALRRQFIDLQLAQISPLYVHHLTRYYKAMKHRNELLKQKSFYGIESYEQEMARSAAFIVVERKKLLKDLKEKSLQVSSLLSRGQDPLELSYRAEKQEVRSEQDFMAAYAKIRVQESQVGYTLCGPHRDDFSLFILGKEIKSFGSEGQKHTTAATLRFSEWHRLYEQAEEKPIMSIDDFGLSLDRTRRATLFSYLQDLGQVFVTTPDELPANILPPGTQLHTL